MQGVWTASEDQRGIGRSAQTNKERKKERNKQTNKKERKTERNKERKKERKPIARPSRPLEQWRGAAWRPLLMALAAVGLRTAAAATSFKKPAKTDVPFAAMRMEPTIELAAAACAADPACAAYNSDGELKRCAGCEGGSDCCVYPAGAQDFPAADRSDLFVKQGNPPPPEWQAGLAAGSLLYAQPEPDLW